MRCDNFLTTRLKFLDCSGKRREEKMHKKRTSIPSPLNTKMILEHFYCTSNNLLERTCLIFQPWTFLFIVLLKKLDLFEIKSFILYFSFFKKTRSTEFRMKIVFSSLFSVNSGKSLYGEFQALAET